MATVLTLLNDIRKHKMLPKHSIARVLRNEYDSWQYSLNFHGKFVPNQLVDRITDFIKLRSKSFTNLTTVSHETECTNRLEDHHCYD